MKHAACPRETVGAPLVVDSDAPVTIVTRDNATQERVVRHRGADSLTRRSGEDFGDLSTGCGWQHLGAFCLAPNPSIAVSIEQRARQKR